MRVLAGDIGGTKTELALYEHDGGYTELSSRRFSSRAYPSFDHVVEEYLQGESVDAAGFAVAGPVAFGRCKATNLPWELDERELSAAIGAPVALQNDFGATVLGIPELDPGDLEWIAENPCDPNGPIAVIGAGTGLGEAIAVPTEHGLRVLSSEGGHADLAPRNEVEIDLLRFLQQRHHKRISVERAVSGPGLVSLHAFVIANGLEPTDPETEAQMQAGDPAEVISRRGLAGDDPACKRALRLFVSLYGSEAGNLALKALPTGGLFIAGGIAPKLIAAAVTRTGVFMQSMLDKGRMSDLLATLPVAVVMNSRVALLGARAQAVAVAESAPSH
jgi:glucokinase